MNHDTFINLLFGRVPRADLTLALVVANVLVFVLLAVQALNPLQIPAELLIRMGGNFAPLVQKGEVWRLATALFLHGGLLHVGLNMFALYQAGQVVERLFGRAGFGLIYLGAGLLGNLASLWWKQGPVSVGASGAIFGVYGALLAYLLVQRGSVPGEVFREMRSGTLGFIGYSLFAGASIAGIDNAAHLGGLAGGLILGAALAGPLVAPRPVRWLGVRAWVGVLLCGVLGAQLWRATPQVAHRIEVNNAYTQTLQEFSVEEQELLRLQGQLLEGLRQRRIREPKALEMVEQELLPRWERQLTQISWRQAPAEAEWKKAELVQYVTARRDALQALAQALRTHEPFWLERFRTLQVQAENVLLQMRLRASLEAGRP